tara:strand:+ start:816 stop:1007 length:192 start_codon:yes stop_codon:yes gene_type:complete
MEENTLSNDEIQSMRAAGVITENEVVVSQGDLLVAIDVVTQSRRVLDKNNMTEGIGRKRLLKG